MKFCSSYKACQAFLVMCLDISCSIRNACLVRLPFQITGENKCSLWPRAGTVLAANLCPLKLAVVEHMQQKQQLDPDLALK